MFLHFFHDQILDTSGLRAKIERHPETFIGAVRGAVLHAAAFSADQLLVPTIDLVQSPVLDRTLDVIRPLVEADVLRFVGSSSNVDELVHRKRVHFAGTRIHQVWAEGPSAQRLSPFVTALDSRSRDTTTDLLERWDDDLCRLNSPPNGQSFAAEQIQHAFRRVPSSPRASDFEAALASIPGRLEDHAFLWNVIESLAIVDFGPAGPAQRHLELAMASNWIMSHLDEYDTKMVSNLPVFGDVSCGVGRTRPDRVVDLVRLQTALRGVSLHQAFEDLGPEEVVALRSEPAFLYARDTALTTLYNLTTGTKTPDVTGIPRLARLGKRAADVRDRYRPYDAIMAVCDHVLEDSADVAPPLPVVGQVVAEVLCDLEDCGDYSGGVKQAFDLLLTQVVRFLATCMDAQPSYGLGRRSYLFDPAATEAQLATDLRDWLSGNFSTGAILVEVQEIGGGRVDLLVHFGDFRLPIELKRTRSDSSKAALRRFVPQVAAYGSTDVDLGMLVVLDLTGAGTGSIRDNVWVTQVAPSDDGGRVRYIVTARVPGGRVTPSRLWRAAE